MDNKNKIITGFSRWLQDSVKNASVKRTDKRCSDRYLPKVCPPPRRRQNQGREKVMIISVVSSREPVVARDQKESVPTPTTGSTWRREARVKAKVRSVVDPQPERQGATPRKIHPKPRQRQKRNQSQERANHHLENWSDQHVVSTRVVHATDKAIVTFGIRQPADFSNKENVLKANSALMHMHQQ